MSRSFNGTNQSLQSASALTALAGKTRLAIGFWINTTFSADDDILLELSANANTTPGTFKVIANESSSNRFWADHNMSDGKSDGSFSAPTSNTWHHVLINYDTTKSTNEVDSIYVDGNARTLTRGNNANTTGAFASDILNVMSRNNAGLFADGQMADLCIWGPASMLTSVEAASLYAGARANTVRNSDILYYWPLAGTTSPEPATIGSVALTVNGATQSADPEAFTLQIPSIPTENLKSGESSEWYTIGGAGDLTNLGFCREFSVDAGETANFSCSGDGTVLDVYRIGYYGGSGWHKVVTLTNMATTQPAAETVADSNGATKCTNWSTTASWVVPASARSGLYVGVYRNAAQNNASWIPFIVRNDDAEADIIYKVSDATWALAYNNFGTMAAPQGKNVYGSGSGIGNITERCHYVSYHRPIITRGGVSQTYWYACEYPMIRFLERNGYNVKYISCKDLDRDPTILEKGKIFLSNGHDEYWSQEMRDAHADWRDTKSGKSLFMSGNEVFWRVRFDATRDGFWCYKDTMPGPGGHVAGQPLDPVHWTGTFKDQRQPGYSGDGEWLTSGTEFRMNGVFDYDTIIVQNPYNSLPQWGNSALNDGNVTIQRVVGFEADSMRATQPEESVVVLAAYTRNINGAYADNNGQNYSGNGDLLWGVISQRYLGGGLTIGFGTCQWSWCLDSTHDRTATPVSPTGQQFVINILGDLGAAPGSLMSGMVARTPVHLDNYGLIPGTVIEDTPVTVLVDGEWVPARLYIKDPEGSDLVEVTPSVWPG